MSGEPHRQRPAEPRGRNLMWAERAAGAAGPAWFPAHRKPPFRTQTPPRSRLDISARKRSLSSCPGSIQRATPKQRDWRPNGCESAAVRDDCVAPHRRTPNHLVNCYRFKDLRGPCPTGMGLALSGYWRVTSSFRWRNVRDLHCDPCAARARPGRHARHRASPDCRRPAGGCPPRSGGGRPWPPGYR